MSNFRTKLLGLALFASASVGVSYGQITCATSANVPLNLAIRNEGGTELVSDASTSCTNAGAATTASQISLSLNAAVTSKAFTPTPAGNTGNSDAAAFICAGAAPAVLPAPGTCGGAVGPFFGTITSASPNTVTFAGTAVGAGLPGPLAIPAGAFYVTFSNVRVNGVGAGQITATPGIQYVSGGLTANATGIGTQAVAIAQPSLSFALTSSNSLATPTGNPPGVATYTTCGGNVYGTTAPTNASFIVAVKEGFTGAFKPLGAGALSGENGSYVPVATGVVGNAGGDQIILQFANIPAGATIFVPQSSVGGGTTLTLSNTTPITTPTGLAGLGGIATSPVAFPVTNGGATVTYTVTGVSAAAATFNIPVFVQFFAPAAAQGPMTILGSYGPIGAVTTGPAASAPLFPASTATPLNGSSVILCQTTLLFPFVTNQLGFDTGMVLANTSIDASLGFPNGTGKSSVAAQTGTCSLSFFGSGAPTPATLVADPGGALGAGVSHAFLLSSVAPGFQGYMIANCPMLYIHGYGFLAYNLTQNNGAVEGYIAEVLTRGPGGDAATF